MDSASGGLVDSAVVGEFMEVTCPVRLGAQRGATMLARVPGEFAHPVLDVVVRFPPVEAAVPVAHALNGRVEQSPLLLASCEAGDIEQPPQGPVEPRITSLR